MFWIYIDIENRHSDHTFCYQIIYDWAGIAITELRLLLLLVILIIVIGIIIMVIIIIIIIIISILSSSLSLSLLLSLILSLFQGFWRACRPQKIKIQLQSFNSTAWMFNYVPDLGISWRSEF